MSQSDLPNGVPRPPHVYVPGKSPRHPEGWFDSLKADVSEVKNPADLHHSCAWQAGMAYLAAGYFWECHEVLEAVWLCTPAGSPEREMTQALIQLANARLKLLMGRPRAAARLCGLADAHLARCPDRALILGLPVKDFQAQLQSVRQEIKHYNT